MKKIDEINNPESCLNRARGDEWLFVLLGRDISAPATVRAWMNDRIARGKKKSDDAQILEAEEWCRSVEAGQK